MKKIIQHIGLLCICLFLLPLSTKAAGNTWVTKSYDDWILEDASTGTSIEIVLKDTTLYVKGHGAIPGFPKDSLGNCPWYGKTVYKIVVDKGITSIGAYAFSHFKDLMNVELPSSIFIEDYTAFGAAHDGCHFYFLGTDIVSRDIGNFPYNNLDNLLEFILKYEYSYTFTFDNYYMISYLNNGVTHKLQNTTPSDALTTNYNPSYPIITYKSEVLSPSTIGINYQKQGSAAINAFSIMLGDNHFAGTYNTFAKDGNMKLNNQYLVTPAQVCLKIPNGFVFPGRKFSIVQIAKGGIINVYDDTDLNDETITFTTSTPVASYMLYFKD